MSSENKRIFLTVVLSGVVLFGWQYYFAPATQPQQAVVKEDVSKTVPEAGSLEHQRAQEILKTDQGSDLDIVKSLIQHKLNNRNYGVTVNSNLQIQDFFSKNQRYSFRSTVGKKIPFRFYVMVQGEQRELFFNFKQSEDNLKLVGYDRNFDVSADMWLSEDGRLNYTLSSKIPRKYIVKMSTTPEKTDDGQIRQFVILEKDAERFEVDDNETRQASVRWMGIDFNYHFFAHVFGTKMPVSYQINSGNLVMDVSNNTNKLSGYFVFLKKNYDDLTAIGDGLNMAVDFGWFSILAVPTLRGLQYIYGVVPNYGWAIVILTLFLRLLTFPLQFKSFKSMKKMQTVQPQLQKIKEKYKDDPQRVQKETMEMFKRAGVNPLGGCMPLLIQMPIFIAFYRVLYAAVELVGAPFVLWINDLSVKDPYYVLPIAFSLSMLLSTKITPSASADPNQRRIMYIMPIVFGFIMKDMPAGLCLYMFVSTILGIGQQLFVYRSVK